MLKVLELFCGAGSFSVALNTLGIDHEIVGFSDIRESAIKLFCKIHNKDPNDNLGDVKNINAKGMDVDLLVFGSPCQSFTRAGSQEGATKKDDSKSSLMWEAVRIMKECKPKWIVWENVPDAINKRHFNNYEEYMLELDEMNYNTYYTVLNANDLGSAQKRKRLFSVSIRKDIDNGKFEFLNFEKKANKLSTYLEKPKDKKHMVEPKVLAKLVVYKDELTYRVRNGTKLGYLEAEEGDSVDTIYPTSKTRRGRVQKESAHTMMRARTIATLQDKELRYLTPFEVWKLQEMPIELYSKVEDCNFGLGKVYDVVGGVINQYHLNTIFISLKKSFNWFKK